ncbi:MAG: formyltransferase family protein [Patescibacteria group bacterium]|nr:formyltransferase family protein [Patescibacteria group bacterium]
MKIVFFGTPEYVLSVIDQIHRKWKDSKGNSPIVAVVTQPPKITGRKKILTYSPVDNWAHKHKIPIFFDTNKLLESKLEWDLGILAAYGQIIPQDVINAFPKGILNIHPSILPEFRGASPIQAIIATEKIPGVTIIKLDNLMDHGPIVSQFADELLESDTLDTLRTRLFQRASQVLINLIPAYLNNKINLKEQNHSQATYTKLIKKEDGYIPFDILQKAMNRKKFKLQVEFIYKRSKYREKRIPLHQIKNGKQLHNLLKAFTPWPGLWTTIKIPSKSKEEQNRNEKIFNTEKRLKILTAHIEGKNEKFYKFVPDLVQLEGKKAVSWNQFEKAYLIKSDL